MVQIRLGHRNVRLGYLDDFDDARRVYLGAKLLLRVFDPAPSCELRLPQVRPLDRMRPVQHRTFGASRSMARFIAANLRRGVILKQSSPMHDML
jgi:hypothetical protein